VIDIVAHIAGNDDRAYRYDSIYAIIIKQNTLFIEVAKQRNQWLCKNSWE